MVLIIDEGSDFDAPLEIVWKLVSSEGQHRHDSQPNRKYEPINEVSGHISFDAMEGGKVVGRHRVKLTRVQPVGFVMEYVGGSMVGTKLFQYYVPKGKKTGVTVVGDATSQLMHGDQLQKAVLTALEVSYNEDRENLKKMT